MFKKDSQACKISPLSALSAPEKAFDPSANILDCARVYFYIFFLEQIYNQDLEASANVHIRLKKKSRIKINQLNISPLIGYMPCDFSSEALSSQTNAKAL